MNREQILEILSRVAAGELDPARAADRFTDMPFEDLGFAKMDHHRTLRRGFPEVIFAENKTVDQIAAIMESLRASGSPILATRVSPDKAALLMDRFPDLEHNPPARTLHKGAMPAGGRGVVLILTAGTSDIPVAEEAATTARVFGNEVETVYDVGVAGLHRLAAAKDAFRRASVIIVVAGMEGALASVVGGIVDVPVIGVPTSVGYGASFGGVAALLAMLNSCSGGVSVVNIDNGFGAAVSATLINRGADRAKGENVT